MPSAILRLMSRPPFLCPRRGILRPSRIQPLFFQHRLQRANELVDLFLSDDEWRQKPEHRLLSAVYDEPLIEQILYYFFARDMELHREHQAGAANFPHNRKAFELFEAGPEMRAGFTDVIEQPVFLDNL